MRKDANGISTSRNNANIGTMLIQTENVNSQSSQSLKGSSKSRVPTTVLMSYPTLASHKFGQKTNSRHFRDLNKLNAVTSREAKKPVRLASGQTTAPAKRARNRRLDDLNDDGSMSE